MNFLIIQEAGRHAENFDYRESLCLHRALSRAGHTSICWGKGYPNFNMITELARWSDVIFILENYDTGWLPDFSAVNRLKMFWSIDGHCVFEKHSQLCQKNKIDIVLNSCYNYVNPMAQYSRFSFWFPNAYPSDLIFNLGEERTIDVGYCGSKGNVERSTLLDRLAAHCGMHLDIDVLGISMVRALNSYKISFNYNLKDDINYRTFESMAAGAMLITNASSGLSNILDTRTQLVTYSDFDDCAAKIDYYLEHESERKEIASAGNKRVASAHTYDARIKRLIDIIKEVA